MTYSVEVTASQTLGPDDLIDFVSTVFDFATRGQEMNAYLVEVRKQNCFPLTLKTNKVIKVVTVIQTPLAVKTHIYFSLKHCFT